MRRMVELREETDVQRSLTERLVRSRVQWAGQEETRKVKAEMGGLC